MSREGADPYYKKTVSVRLRDTELRLQVAHDLFSSHDVDTGTTLLLRTLKDAKAHKVLDLGCGYGPLGLGLKAMEPGREVHLVDRDALAVEFSRRNVADNDFENVTVGGTLGYDDVTGNDFDLIVSNLPGKSGAGVLAHLMLDGRSFLSDGGFMAVVIVEALASEAKAVLSIPGVELLLERHNNRHAVFHYRFTERPPAYVNAFQRGVYDRAELVVGERRFPTAHGIAEFNSLSFATDLLLGQLGTAGWGGSVAVLNPGQGVVPSATVDHFQPQSMILCDRDLLEIRMSERNLGLFGSPAELSSQHADRLSAQDLDLVVASIPVKEPAGYSTSRMEGAVRSLGRGGSLVLAGTSTAVTRVTGHLEGLQLARSHSRRQKKGFSAVTFKAN